VRPIQIVPLRLEALQAPVTTPKLTYRGGPLLTSVQVSTFFWGSAWQHAPQAKLVTQLNDFFDYVLTSPLLDQLAEYSVQGMAIGHGARSGTATVTQDPAGSSIADADVQAFVQQQVP